MFFFFFVCWFLLYFLFSSFYHILMNKDVYISHDKTRDLLALCKSGIIPREHQDFFSACRQRLTVNVLLPIFILHHLKGFVIILYWRAVNRILTDYALVQRRHNYGTAVLFSSAISTLFYISTTINITIITKQTLHWFDFVTLVM